MVIRNKSFDHKGGFYHYRVHLSDTDKLCNDGLRPLNDYLKEMFEKCPDDYFHKGPRSSKLKFNLQYLDLKSVSGHEVCHLTNLGLDRNNERYKTNHSRVQVFMMEHDSKSIASEIPLWFMPDEFEFFKEIFDSDEPLTGHVDLVRIEDGKIWIWDYKPKARLEKFASTQIYFYALMLSARTKIPLEKFRCGYFDDRNCYVFDPNKCKIPEMKSISEFM